MPDLLLILACWLAIALIAAFAARPGDEERDALGGERLSTLLFSFDEARNRRQWSLETENLARRIRRRTWIAACVVLLALPIGIVLTLGEEPLDDDEDLAIELELEEDERPVTRPPPEPEEEKVLVRTYRRKAGDRGPPEVIEEYRVETLEEKRDPIRLYGTAKVAAKYDVDQLLGIRITNIQPGSFWEIVGFREGDFILEANGELMDNPNTSVAFMNSMQTAPEVRVRVRGADDVERTLYYVAPKD